MRRKALPYIFLFILLLIIVFLAGSYYGRSVKQVNEVLTYLLSITPTPSPQLSPSVTEKPQTVNYSRITVSPCRVSFALPETYTSEPISSFSAHIAEKDGKPIQVSCSSQESIFSELPVIATDSSIIDSASASATLKGTTDKQYEIRIRHPRTGRILQLVIPEEMYTLVTSSFSFE